MINTAPLVDAGKSSFETLFGLSGQALDGVEQLTALNLQTTKSLMSAFAQDSDALLSAKSPDDLVRLQTLAMQTAPQKAAAYLRQVQDIVNRASSAQNATLQAQMAAFQSWLLDGVTSALKDAPGTENAVAMMKSAIVAANQAVEGAQQAHKQVSAAVAANMAKLGEAA